MRSEKLIGNQIEQPLAIFLCNKESEVIVKDKDITKLGWAAEGSRPRVQ